MEPARPRRRSAWPLLAAWLAYWAVLALVVLGGPALRVWRLTHDPALHGSATMHLADNLLTASVIEGGATVWSTSTHLVTIALWIAGPPLLLFLIWLRSRSRDADGARPGAAPAPAGVTAGRASDARAAEALRSPAPDVLRR
ncbi:MAG TPA: hypothetical protein VGD56_00930 [Gemmatirosa sp.]